MKHSLCRFQRSSTLRLCLLLIGCGVLGVSQSVRAAEFFVELKGSDSADGLTPESAFASIQKGVDALSPGDTLTIGPGEYFGSVYRTDVGGVDADTTIRAKIPGTVLLRGDKPAPEFKLVPGKSHLYAADFDGDVQVVNEDDTLSQLKDAPSVDEVNFSAGSFYHDKATKKLYISTTDMRPPEKHTYSVSVVSNHGLHIDNPKRIVVDGLAFRGFNTVVPLRDHRPQYATWGLFFPNAVKCVVRNSIAFLNGGGILIATAEGEGNLIEECMGYGNGSPHNSEGGNISIFAANNDTIRNCTGYRSTGTGVRIYGTARGKNIIEGSLGWGNRGPDGMKGAGLDEGGGIIRNTISLHNLAGVRFAHNIVGQKLVNITPEALTKDNVFLSQESLSLLREFVDPLNFDFRLQSNSKLRGSAPDGSDRGPFPFKPNVYFVRPQGDDGADGLSMKTAWKTAPHAFENLKPGDTVYFEEGDYAGPVTIMAGKPEGGPIKIRARGVAHVLFTDSVTVNSSAGLVFERLNFASTLNVKKSSDVRFISCRFDAGSEGLAATDTSGLRVSHCEFTGNPKAALSLQNCTGTMLSSNLFANAGGVAVQIGSANRSLWEGVGRSLQSLVGKEEPTLTLEPAILISNHNAYSNPAKVWSVNGRVLSLEQLKKLQDHQSFSSAFAFTGEGGRRVLPERQYFKARGALGRNVGFHQDLQGERLFMSEPVVHSVTSTTANIEWLVSRGADCDIAWGETPECENKQKMTINTFLDLFRTYSLTGLKPGTKYYFRVQGIRMLAYPDFGEAEVVDPHYDVISFTTPASDPAPRSLYVAPDGSDGNSGLSRDQAWRSVSHAASQAAPGDTVWIAGGTYVEKVRVRTTGEKNKPISFRSLPGEKVIFDGNERRLDNAWTINGKSNIVVDGFYFLNHRGEPGGNVSTRLFDVVQSRDILIRRCMMNGLGGGAYPASFLTGWTTPNLTMSNCVSILAPDGVEVTDCPDFKIENSVFILTMICNVKIGAKATLANNIFCDSGEFKALQKIQLHMYGGVGGVNDRNNCYYFRLPDEERVAFILKWPDKISLAGLKKLQPDTDSYIADPQFAILEKIPEKDRKLFSADALYQHGNNMDFPDLFATNPEVVAHGSGLQPDAFLDFHFAKKVDSPQ